MNDILYLGSSRFSQMMNTERWQLTQGMIQDDRYSFVDLHRTERDAVDLYAVWKNVGKPGTVILEDHEWAWKLKLPLKYRNVHKVDAVIWAFIADYWYERQEKRDYYEENNITGLIALHQAANDYILKYFGDLISHVVNIPFTVDKKEFARGLQDKTHDVVCSGFMGELYPFRRRIRDILKNSRRVKSLFLEHPGHWKENQNIGLRGKDYYQLMGKCKFVLSTTGTHNISVRKHIEAIGARSKIIGNTTGFREHSLVGNFVLQLAPEMPDEEIISRILEGCSIWVWSEVDEKRRAYLLHKHAPLTVARTLRGKLTHFS